MAYELRDKAFEEWQRQTCDLPPELRHFMPGIKEAFKAGWKARKEAELKARLNPRGMKHYSTMQGR